MELAEEIFTNKIDNLAKALDSLGLYVVDLAMVLVNTDGSSIDSLESLRKVVVSGVNALYFDVECIAGNEAWRSHESLFEMDFSDIEDYFK